MNEIKSSSAAKVKGPGGHNFKNIAGQRFGRLIAMARISDGSGNARWRCQCDCGKTKNVFSQKLNSGNTKSCGCLRSEMISQRVTIHGFAKGKKPPEYHAWVAMSARCYNQKSPFYRRYGGRGILVCDRWRKSFQSFYDDMGKRPSMGYSVERENRDGDYEPTNCRWATAKVQANNTCRNHLISYDGITLTMAQWSEKIGIPYFRLAARLNRLKWSPKKALTTP